VSLGFMIFTPHRLKTGTPHSIGRGTLEREINNDDG
jgi:hypothetical protein